MVGGGVNTPRDLHLVHLVNFQTLILSPGLHTQKSAPPRKHRTIHTCKVNTVLTRRFHNRRCSDLLLLVKEVLDDLILAFGVVEIDEETPVD